MRLRQYWLFYRKIRKPEIRGAPQVFRASLFGVKRTAGLSFKNTPSIVSGGGGQP